MISACQKDDNPIDSNYAQVFAISGYIFEIDELDNHSFSKENIVYLYCNDELLDTSRQIDGRGFKFDSLNSKKVYKLIIKKQGYENLDTTFTISQNGMGGAIWPNNYYGNVNIGDFFLFQPLVYPKITEYNIYYAKDTLLMGEDKNSRLYYTNYIDFKLNMTRDNIGLCYSISKTTDFDVKNCIVYNKIIYRDVKWDNNSIKVNTPKTYKDLNDETGDGTVLPGEKYYFKVQMVKNGAIREKDSRELGEPLIVETTAPLD